MRNDERYLLDMPVAAHKAMRFSRGSAHARFSQSDLHQNPVLKILEIIGEAASRIRDDTKTAHP